MENAVMECQLKVFSPAIGEEWRQTFEDSIKLKLGIDILLLELLVGRHVHAC
jgi:hypothetical protein